MANIYVCVHQCLPCIPTAHGKGNVFVVHLVLAHSKCNIQANRGNVRWEKNLRCSKEKRMTNYLFAVRSIKTHGKLFFYPRFFLPCAVKNTHGKALFPVRLKKHARQRSERTANVDFPMILCPELLLVLKLKACDSSTTCNINNPTTNL
jgi:hypothetical protein